MKGNILPSGPRAPADSQVYLAILVALSCPFYIPLGMSAAITLPSSPWADGVRGGVGGPGQNRWESVHDMWPITKHTPLR